MKVEILRLFKGYLGEKTSSVNKEALPYGLIIPATADAEVVQEAIKQYGKDGVLWNQTFHKSWDKVANAPLMQLYLEQIVHYITTYGFESLGVYDENSVYIPSEKLEIPELDVDSIRFTVIKALSEDELKEKLMILVTSGIALSKQTIGDIKVLSDYIDRNRFDEVANREVRTYLYDKYNVMPKNPEVFLRYLIFKLTHETLKIKNKKTYQLLSMSDKGVALSMLQAYGDYEKLSSIFLRNKEIFLALKVHPIHKDDKKAPINTIINKLRKLAVKNHKALKPALLDNLTSRTNYTAEEIKEALEKVPMFRAIRLMNALAYRLCANNDIVYRIRNGKSYVSKIRPDGEKLPAKAEAAYRMAYETIQDYVTGKLHDKVSGKYVYIPEGVIYKAPTSEKQFVCHIPEGSYCELPKDQDLVFAVHWYNLRGGASSWGDPGRVDLDMHMMNSSEQFGWNTNYRDSEGKILFSGDMTSAPRPNGATEAYLIKHELEKQAYLVTLNDFNGHNTDVPYEFIVAYEDRHFKPFGKDYMVDPNKIIHKLNFKIEPDQRQNALGMVKVGEDNLRFYFSNYGVGASCAITSRNASTLGAYSYLNSYNEVQTTLNKLLMDAGAIVVNTPTVEVTVQNRMEDGSIVEEVKTIPVDLDLSLENVTKDTFISLFVK